MRKLRRAAEAGLGQEGGGRAVGRRWLFQCLWKLFLVPTLPTLKLVNCMLHAGSKI